MATANATRWFVKSDGKIRGPFAFSVLVSMKQRGRLFGNTEVSEDRREWYRAAEIETLFDELEDHTPLPAGQGEMITVGPVQSGVPLPPEMPLPPDSTSVVVAQPAPDAKCFYSMDGIVHGPLPITALQERATAGQLAPTDYIWMEGHPEWSQASLIPQLRFPTEHAKQASFIRSHPGLVISLAFVLLMLLGIPTWYVVGTLNQAARAERAAVEVAERAREDKEKAEARAERDKDKDLARAEREEDRKVELSRIEAQKAAKEAEHALALLTMAQQAREAAEERKDTQAERKAQHDIDRLRIKADEAIAAARLKLDRNRIEEDQAAKDAARTEAQALRDFIEDQNDQDRDLQRQLAGLFKVGQVVQSPHTWAWWRGRITRVQGADRYSVQIELSDVDHYVAGRTYTLHKLQFELVP